MQKLPLEREEKGGGLLDEKGYMERGLMQSKEGMRLRKKKHPDVSECS